MSALVRLYPRAWRDRYEAEFAALLEARPPTFGDRFDIVLGALDARLHPQVRTAGEPPDVSEERRADLVIARRFGLGALAGAALWFATWAIALSGPMVYEGDGTSYRDGAAALPPFFVAVWLLVGGLVGQAIWLPASARLARAGVFIAIPFLMFWSFGPWILFGLVGAVVGLVTLAVGTARAGLWPVVVSAVLASSVVALLVLFLLGFSGLIALPPDLGPLLLFGLALPMWLAVGGSLVAWTSPPRLRPA
ncbi:MAG TPA: hypothetical protein VFO05_02055 [Candidatus Limnocylindrales bacterium]|nr:hypothetical protein [Candidatus Limnocylindrales bacterium]